jgi:hypothetical protein
MGWHRELQWDYGITDRKIKNCFPIARETRMNKGFVTCYTLEDTIAISEPVIVGQ